MNRQFKFSVWYTAVTWLRWWRELPVGHASQQDQFTDDDNSDQNLTLCSTASLQHNAEREIQAESSEHTAKSIHSHTHELKHSPTSAYNSTLVANNTIGYLTNSHQRRLHTQRLQL